MFRHQTAKPSVRTVINLGVPFLSETNNLLRLAAVNFFLGCVGVTQVTRILMYQRSQQAASARQIAEKDAKDVANTVKGIATDPEGAVHKAVK